MTVKNRCYFLLGTLYDVKLTARFDFFKPASDEQMIFPYISRQTASEEQTISPAKNQAENMSPENPLMIFIGSNPGKTQT